MAEAHKGSRRTFQRKYWQVWRHQVYVSHMVMARRQVADENAARRTFEGLAQNLARARAARQLAKRSRCRCDLEATQRAAWASWRRAAAPRSAGRSLARRRLSKRLHFWRCWASTLSHAARARRGALQLSLARTAMCHTYTRRRHLQRWAACAKEARRRHVRSVTIRERLRLSLLHRVWQTWISIWKAALRGRRKGLEAKIVEMRSGHVVLEHELNALRSERSADELARLGIIDELQEAAAEVAALAIGVDEVRSVMHSLEKATAVESQVAHERYGEAEALRAAQESLAMRRREHYEVLQSRYQEALVVPAELQAELRERQAQREVEIAAEAEAKETTALLRSELENLHQMVPQRLRDREEDVARLQEWVAQTHQVVVGMEEEQFELQLLLQARDSALEEMHQEETMRDLTLFHSTLALG